MHPDSPFTGEQLGKQVVSFEKVKVTNNELDKAGHVCMHAHKTDHPFTANHSQLDAQISTAYTSTQVDWGQWTTVGELVVVTVDQRSAST